MKKILLQCTLVLFSIPIWGYINQNNDVQLWVAEVLHKEISSRCNLLISNEWRIGDNVSKFYFFYLQGAVEFKSNSFCNLTPGYRQIWALRDSKWRLAYEPFFDVLFIKSKYFQFRNRISYIAREATFNVWQERVRIRLTGEIKIGSRVCRPYVSNEVFVRTQSGFNQNRLMAGVLVPIYGTIHGDFCFLLRFLKSKHHWTHQNVFGTWVKLNF